MDPINKNSYTDVRSRIRSQIFNRILNKPNPDYYEMVSSVVSGTSKSLGGGISLPDRIKDLLVLGERNNSSTKTDETGKASGSSVIREINSKEKESETNENNEEGNISLLPTSGSGGSQVLPERSEPSGGVDGERETFISLSTLAKFVGTDRKKLQRAILQYSVVYGEVLYNVESNSYQIPIKSASVLVLGKKMVERGESRSYREAFRLIKNRTDEDIKRELEQIENSIKTYVREAKSEIEVEAKGEGPPREDEKEALGVVEIMAEALIEASSSITNRINEIENLILDFHYTFLKIKQEVESVRGELERIEKMVAEYLIRKQG